MRASGVREVLVYRRDHRYGHHVEISHLTRTIVALLGSSRTALGLGVVLQLAKPSAPHVPAAGGFCTSRSVSLALANASHSSESFSHASPSIGARAPAARSLQSWVLPAKLNYFVPHRVLPPEWSIQTADESWQNC